MLSKTYKENNNVLLVDSKNKNLYLMIWNALEKTFQKITLEVDDTRSIIDEEFEVKRKTVIHMNQTVYRGKTRNQYPHYLQLLKEYDNENYQKTKTITPIEEDEYDEWVPTEPYESYDQLGYKGINWWRVQ